MAPNSFVVGEVVRLSIAATDLAGLAAEPGGITLKLKPPVGAVSAYAYGAAPEVVRDGVGRYRADIPLTTAGPWAYRWELSAPNAGAAEGVITVQKSRVI